jgi:hypothetical protein
MRSCLAVGSLRDVRGYIARHGTLSRAKSGYVESNLDRVGINRPGVREDYGAQAQCDYQSKFGIPATHRCRRGI